VNAPPASAPGTRSLPLTEAGALDDGGLELTPEAHRLLGLSTLLINFAEHAAQTRDDPGAASRVSAFTQPELPRCFRRSAHAATLYEFDCGLGLCGPTARGPVGKRRFSRAFTKRAEATARAPVLAHRRVFPRQAFSNVWRELDEELTQGRDA
jgi:hypothetical protein